jgi:hypothetical protein
MVAALSCSSRDALQPEQQRSAWHLSWVKSLETPWGTKHAMNVA